jgi:histidine triad (HIT) family protein
MTSDCLFCKIVAGEIPSKKLYEDELAYAFYDVNPQAPVHFLVVPKEHLAGISEATETHEPLLGHLMLVAQKLALQAGCTNGARFVVNSVADGGQTVAHLHVHVLAGRQLAWPPG